MTAGRMSFGTDHFKIAAAILVIAIHTGPLTTYSPYGDYLLTGIAARLAVPFFFVASGYFLFRKLKGEKAHDSIVFKQFMSKIGQLYGLSIVLYLPLNIYSGYFSESLTPFTILKDLVFDGTFYHLWYLPALMLGTAVVFYVYGHCSFRTLFALTASMYIIGLLGDSYFGWARQIPALHALYGWLFQWFDYTRNGLLFAPLYMALGAWTARRNPAPKRLKAGIGWLLASLCLLFAEGILLRAYGVPRHDSMYVFLVPAVYVLFLLLLGRPGGDDKNLRRISTWMYIVHPIAIVLVRGAGKAAGIGPVVVSNSAGHFLAVTAVSVLLAVFIVRFTGKKPKSTHRAWAEIRLDSITHNVNELRRVLPPECGLMAVMKADAYGHGSAAVSKHLNRIGIRHFAVAEINEGIALRKKGVKGEILVLGYTAPSRFKDLRRYNLAQTVIGADYADALSRFGKPLRVHIKIDTGMSRLGERCDNRERIYSMYRHRNLRISGTFTHLSEADSLEEKDIAFTEAQISRFFEIAAQLRRQGIDPGRLHIQSSYGILNYPGLSCGMARPGIVLYGLLGREDDEVRTEIDLRPAFSLKARIALVKEMKAEEGVGYGRMYTAVKPGKIATVCIGYADGVPRMLAKNGGAVLIRGQRAPIAGNICMDQLMAEVTHIGDVKEGDVVTIIGRDGEETITTGEVARLCGTIANEIVSGIGSRVVRVYTDEAGARPSF